MTHTVALAADVRAVVERSTITATSLTLPDALTRELYVRVDKVLKAAGGTWNRRAKAHLFTQDPRVALGLAVTTGEILDTKKARQQFFTPAPLAAQLVDRAGVAPGMLVLEPSAGAGSIARAAAAAGGQVQCVEMDPALASTLAASFQTTCWNFLTVPPTPVFDRVVMNPPFEKGQDIDHVTHALWFLKMGGRLVAVMAAGVTFNQSKKHQRFRALVEEAGGTIEKLPDDSFHESGTGARTVVVTVPR